MSTNQIPGETSYENKKTGTRFIDAWNGSQSLLYYLTPERTLCLTKYNADMEKRQKETAADAYLGGCAETIRRQGRDVLGLAALAKGEPGFDHMDGLLPPIRRGGFGFVASQNSWNGVMVDQTGALLPQSPRHADCQVKLFSPAEIDPRLGTLPPTLSWLDGDIPAVVATFRDGENTLELLYIVESGDPGSAPDVWVRVRTICNQTERTLSQRFLIVGMDGEAVRMPTDADAFYGVLAGVIDAWSGFHGHTSTLALPEPELTRRVRGALAYAASTFSDAHPHYGHMRYGWEVHDHFPPTVLTAIEAYLLLGQSELAGRVADYLLRAMIDSSGRFCYRQGGQRVSGASASEYGHLLWLLERFAARLEPICPVRSRIATLRKIGGVLLEARQPDERFPDLRLIRMCAEADTNGRIYSYIQNSFWAVRGLEALSRLTGDASYAREAADLLHDAKLAVSRLRVSTRFGVLPPFRVGYTATPLTLSDCRDTYEPVSDETWYRYLSVSDSQCRDKVESSQDYAENTYANYRYYLEMLSARLLEPEEEDGIVALREALGGELLGMTRFLERVDDWPVFHYARFLLETDRIDKYLLLLYAHTRFHGLPDMGIYYEQFGVDGTVFAPDCVPSVLITPLMTAWALVFEPVGEEALYLFRAAPKRWFREGFSAERLGSSRGDVSIRVQPMPGEYLIEAELPLCPDSVPVYLDLRTLPEIAPESLLEGGESVAAIHGCRLRLRAGNSKIRLRIKE